MRGERCARLLPVVAELALGAPRAEHMQLVVDARIGTPLVGRVLVVARLPAALGADGRCFGGRVTPHHAARRLLGW